MDDILYRYNSDCGPILSVGVGAWKYPYRSFTFSAAEHGAAFEAEFSEFARALENGRAANVGDASHINGLCARYIAHLVDDADKKGSDETIRRMLLVLGLYGKTSPRLRANIPEWLCDFCLVSGEPTRIYGLCADVIPTVSFAGDFLIYDYLKDMFSSKRNEKSTEKLFLALPYMCAYKYEDSRYYAENCDVYRKAFSAVITAVLENTLCREGRDFFVPAPKKIMRSAYSGLMCSFESAKVLEIEYIPYSENDRLFGLVTAVVKHTDNLVRQGLGVKSKIMGAGLSADLRKLCADTVRSEIPGLLAMPAKVGRKPKEKKAVPPPSVEKVQAEPISLEIDFSKAKRLEAESWRITRLMEADYGTDQLSLRLEDLQNIGSDIQTSGYVEENENNADAAADVPEEWAEFYLSLTENEKKILCCISRGEDTVSLARSLGGMPLGFADSINEKALDTYGDLVIDTTGEVLRFYCDYDRELCGIFCDLYNTEVL